MSSVIRIRVLAGLCPGDLHPDIAGCVSETIWEVEGDEDTEKRWAACKEDYGPHAGEYTWREIVVEIPEHQIMRYFESPVISARVDTSEPTVEA